MTAAQLAQVKNKMLDAAIKADTNYTINVIKAFPLSKLTFNQDPVTKEYKSAESSLATYFSVGNSAFLIDTYMKSYESILRKTALTSTINNITKEYKFLEANDSNLEFLRKLFVSANKYRIGGYAYPNPIDEALKNAKLLSVSNTIEILQLAGLTIVQPVSSTSLSALLPQVDWAKISGVTKTNLESEIAELKKLEDIK